METSIELTRVAQGLPERISTRIQRLLAASPDPDKAALRLGQLKQESLSGFSRIAASPEALRCAIAVFSFSEFLSSDVIHNPELILQAAASGSLHRTLRSEEFAQKLIERIGTDSGIPPAAELARFRRRQLLRIVLRDALGVATLTDVTDELSSLADAVLDVAYRRIRSSLVARHGEPLLAGGGPCGLSVISLGKLGGRELNYSSDIDLMFVYGGPGATNGAAPLSNAEFYKKVANEYIALLSTYTADGQSYRVDLRLRPDGRLGEICISEEGAEAYYAHRGRDWEKQMLIKARVSAGEPEPGQALLEFVEPLIYESSLDFRSVEAVSETRQRMSEKTVSKRALQGGPDVKLAPGGIRDIEFLAQCLQRLHGGREPWVRHGGTMLALFRLHDKGLLSPTEYSRLAEAYQFLRHIEHRLQIEEDRQTHTLPTDFDALDRIARRMPGGTLADGDALMARLEQCQTDVREIYERVIYAQKPVYYTLPAPPAPWEEDHEATAQPTSLTRFLDERAPQLAEALAGSDLRRGQERFQHFLERAFAAPEILARLEADPTLAAGALDLFEHSPYFADALLRDPEMLEEIGRDSVLRLDPLETASSLRRFYGRQMLRIQSRSVLNGAPIFETLAQTSALADCVIEAAYRLALSESQRPASGEYEPRKQMMVIALGRLGMREFDLGSDADLLFVLPDADAGEQPFWSSVAEHMIDTLSAYTGVGVMFAVDTRLRPNGREGDLVQTESAYRRYFENQAEAWEGITYMKSRGVAGDVERATEFLTDLQTIDWRRYGRSKRSRRDLAEMRVRLEREQGARNPLKAGGGGYYDIDFVLMYLRLKGAGIFYRVLNTPERIRVIEQMGHLDPEDADFLRDASTFYRALDHGQRVSTGHAEGKLPSAESQLETLAALVRRWTPESMHRQSLEATLYEIRLGTRRMFNRLFLE